MAGDWIKMRMNLSQDPGVIRIASKLNISEDEVVGKLHKFWSWANSQTEDGNVPGVTESWVDRYIGVTGFAKLLSEGDGNTPWLLISDEGIQIPNFDRHNGKSAKNRALTSERVSTHRKKKDVTDEALQNRYQRREEKRREEKMREETEPSKSSLSLPDRNLSLDDDTPTNRFIKAYQQKRPTAGHPLAILSATEIQDTRLRIEEFIDWAGEARIDELIDAIFLPKRQKPTSINQALLFAGVIVQGEEKAKTKKENQDAADASKPKLWSQQIEQWEGRESNDVRAERNAARIKTLLERKSIPAANGT